MTNEQALRTLTDRAEITELLHRYCRAVDRLDHQLGYSVWHPDGEADYGPAIFQGTGHGFIDQVIDQHGKCDRTQHQVTNIIFDLQGDSARTEAYCIAAIRISRDGKPNEIRVWSRYIDTWSRRDGRWGIDKRVTLRDFDDIRAVTPLSDDRGFGRNGTDISDTILGPLA